MAKALTNPSFDYGTVSEDEATSRWVYIFGMENEGDMLGSLLSFMSGDLYKVGTTISPIRRWRQVQVHSPWDLRVFAVFPGGFSTEAETHRLLSEWHTRGEWFDVPRSVMCELLDQLEDRTSIGRLMFPTLPWAHYVTGKQLLEVTDGQDTHGPSV